MKLSELFQTKKCPFAIEVFPPKRTSAVESVYATLEKISEIPADYVSVTYSAGGSGAREYTAQIAGFLQDRLGILPLAHLTCMNSKRGEVEAELERLKTIGVENIMALRGDKNPDLPPAEDFFHASDLMREIQRFGDFYIVGACYPEGHPDSPGLDEDIAHLKTKLDAGAGHFVSQLFYDNAKFYSFLERARASGIACPIEAGVMPVVRVEQVGRVVDLSSASLPAGFVDWVEKYRNDADSFYGAGIDFAIRQIRELIEQGADGIHLYAMNKPDVARRIYDGVRDLL